MARDPFRLFTVEELAARDTISEYRLKPPLDVFVQEIKLVDGGYRYSLVRDTRDPNRAPRVVVEEQRDGGRWWVVHPLSILGVVDPSERAAIDAAERGDHVMALLLIHALTEAIMRTDPGLRARSRDGFAGVSRAFVRRLDERQLPDVNPDALATRLRAMNDVRNNVVHLWLGLHGLAATNERIAAGFPEWKTTYDTVLRAAFEYLSM